MDPEVLAMWLCENGPIEWRTSENGIRTAERLADALVEEFVLRRRFKHDPSRDTDGYQPKWNNPNLPTYRIMEIPD